MFGPLLTSSVFLFVFEECGFFLRSEFKMDVSRSVVLFGPPQAEIFAVVRFLFTFLHVSTAISLVSERTFSRLSKKSTYSGIFQLGVRGIKKIYPRMLVLLVSSDCYDHCDRAHILLLK